MKFRGWVLLIALAAACLAFALLRAAPTGGVMGAQKPTGTPAPTVPASVDVCAICVVVDERALEPGEIETCGTFTREVLLDREYLVQAICTPSSEGGDRILFLACPICMFGPDEVKE